MTSLNNIGSVYSNKKSTWDQSIEYFMRAYKLSKVLGDQYLIGTATVNLGDVLYKRATIIMHCYTSTSRSRHLKDRRTCGMR